MKRNLRNLSGYAWVVVALLWPVAMLNYLDRQMVATIRASIRADIPSIANDQDFGTLMAVFMWVYAFLSPLGGFVADKFNRRWTVIGSLGVWSAVTWATGHATTYSQMLCFRGLMGISEAFYIPAALALIADFHTGGTRARAVGIHQSGIYAGLALGGIGGYIAQTSSWRNCFTWFGAAGVIYSVVLMLALRDAAGTAGETGPKKPSVTVAETVRALVAAAGLLDSGHLFYASGHCRLGDEELAADLFWPTRSTSRKARPGCRPRATSRWRRLSACCSAAWSPIGGCARRRAAAFIPAPSACFLLVPALLSLGYAWNLGVAIAAMILFGIGWGFFDCNNMPILCQIARPEHRATGYGFMNFVSISVGAGATVLLGWMRDHGVKFSVAFAASAAVAL